MKNGAWRKWAASLRKNTYALYLASKDPRVPALSRIIIAVVVGYALSPIDLIPDFIPVLGYLDDLVLLPIGIWLAVRLIPESVWTDCQALAAGRTSDVPHNYQAALVIMIIWAIAIAGFIFWLWKFVSGVKSTWQLQLNRSRSLTRVMWTLRATLPYWQDVRVMTRYLKPLYFVETNLR